jgi:flagellar protein FliL
MEEVPDMGRKRKDAEAGGDEEQRSGGRLKLVVAAVVLVAAGAGIGAKVLGGGATPASATGPTTTTTEPHGPVTTVDSITVNLADGRFLKLGLAFEVGHDEQYPPADVEVDEYTKGFAREIDASIMVLSTFTFEQLVAPDGKVMAKRALVDRLAEVSDGAVRDVLFHEFVMQ